MLKNWKTTCCGGIGGLPMPIEGITTKDWTKAAYGLGVLLLGLFAKDGGTKQKVL